MAKLIRFLFDKFMRGYAFIFVVLALLAFGANEFVPKYYINDLVKVWLCFNFFLVVLAFGFQGKLRNIVSNDINKMMFLARVVNEDRLFDNVKLILHTESHIPSEFETYDSNANDILQFSQKLPYIYDVSHTVYDKNFIRFSWLAIIKKTEPNEFIQKLKIGDIIFYHRNYSIIGFIIRFFTRCYWEHSAVYAGEGFVIEASPGGVKKIKIEPWINDKKVSLGILRLNFVFHKKFKAEMEKHIGEGYAYKEVMRYWWRIVTGGTRLGFMTPLVLVLNLVQFGIASYIAFAFPCYTRLQIATVLLTAPYMFDSIHHKIAYAKNLDFFSEVGYEKS